MNKKIRAHVISHTHWDREWYQTFQQYRSRLVRMVDDLINNLEKSEDYKCFHFDGQTIMIEDYLRIRPENKERLYKLIKNKRIIIGPWYVMPDEFLISGESLIRNLQKGIKICSDLGVKSMMSGYVTDIFGHNSQFPQLLRGFNIDNAVLYRGIGDYDKDLFNWQGADGSSVTVCKLEKNRSYSNFYFALRWPYENLEYSDEDLINRGKELITYLEPLCVTDLILMMDGVDHIDMEIDLPRKLKVLNENIDDVEFIHSNLDDYLEELRNKKLSLDTITGSLYNLAKEGINNQVLKNVLSSMVHLKQKNDLCEMKLSRQAELLEVIISQITDNLDEKTLEHSMLPFKGYLDEAWEYLLKNQPHDSICGCSTSDVHRDNEYRFRQCEQIADMLIENGLKIIANNINFDPKGENGSFIVFNFGQEQSVGNTIVDVQIPSGHTNNFIIYNSENEIIDYQILDMKMQQIKVSDYNKLITFRHDDIITLALPLSIPPLGYTTCSYTINRSELHGVGEYKHKKVMQPFRTVGTMRTGANSFDNGLLKITINQNGSLNIINKLTSKVYENILTFEDCGDFGDGWNYRKPLLDAEYLSSCSNATVAILSDGPLASVIKIIHKLDLPVDYNGSSKRQGDKDILTIETDITIKNNSYRLDFKTKVKNNISCHRLRVIFPTAFDTDVYYTATPFDMQKWNIKKADTSNYQETETGVTPSQGITFLRDKNNSCAVYSKGLYEVEVKDNESTEIALTLYRAFLSETGTLYRDLANMKMDLTFDYSFDLTPQNECEALIFGQSYRKGLKSYAITSKGNLEKEKAFLTISNPKIALSTTHCSSNNEYILRLFSLSENFEKTEIVVPNNIKKATIVDLVGNEIGTVEFNKNILKLDFEPKKIITLKLSR